MMGSSFFKKIGLSIALFLLPLNIYGVIHKAKTMDEVISFFQEITSTDLALFDVDGVLVVPSDPALQFSNFNYYKFTVWKKVLPLSHLEKDCFGTLLTTASLPQIVDMKVFSLFEMLDRRGVKALALSAILTGSTDKIENLTKWRYCDLKRLGLDFSFFFPTPSEVIYDQFDAYGNSFPSFYNGVILSNGCFSPVKKGDVLVFFLSSINRIVNTVYFVEDTWENLTSTEEILKEKMPEIQFVGIYYTGAHDSDTPTVDQATFDKRMDELTEEAKIMANKKAA